MFRATRLIILILVLCPAAFSQLPQLKDAEFQSTSLGREMKYRVLLPASYDQGDTRYPVLYLLHGLYGNYKNWTDNTAVQKYASGMDLIIAMPDGEDSWYTNWSTDPKQKFEDYMVKDFIAEVESKYRTTPTRETRYIAGLSMGGYGALKFSIRYPQLFSIAGSFSGALNAPTTLQSEKPVYALQLLRVYGRNGNKTRSENDISRLISTAKPASLPYLYLTCGEDDYFVSPNRQFVSNLPSLKVRYEYHELPGVHDWRFWDSSIRDFLQLIRSR